MRESLRKIFDMAAPTSLSRIGQSTGQGGGNNSSNSNGNSVSMGSLSLINANGSSGINGSSNGVGNSSSSNSASATHEDKNFLLNLESSKWLEHVRAVLNGALQIVKYMNDHSSSVLVHCSDGWDRTSQVGHI